ncbi:MAG TPA: ABC transporter ATP-binding protein [Candidatus Korarchaeota archaeon]|nr:ABC transporter ATP-binding protein [Candidatus Korarchaeota archaeon]
MEVRDLKVRFYTYEGVVKAIDGVDLDVLDGETLGIVGETGSGKSVTTYAMMNLIPPPGKIVAGRVVYYRDGKPLVLTEMGEEDLRKLRGAEISRIFQEPKAALNPVFKVGDQVAEAILIHRMGEMIERAIATLEEETKAGGLRGALARAKLAVMRMARENPDGLALKLLLKIPILRRLYWSPVSAEARKDVVRLLGLMGIPDPNRVYDMYPHELSGGMQQRIVIATALSCNPRMLIADEPTTNLDVTVEAQILELMKELKKQFGSTLVYITHDMGVIAEVSDRVAVMYAGNICEVADVFTLFKEPLHPYTRGLLEAIPMPGRELKAIPGTVPNLINPPTGCRFHPRCAHAMPKCKEHKPKLVEVKPGHKVACFLYHDQVADEGGEE